MNEAKMSLKSYKNNYAMKEAVFPLETGFFQKVKFIQGSS